MADRKKESRTEYPISFISKLRGTNSSQNGGSNYSDDIHYTQDYVFPPRNRNPSLAMRMRNLEYLTSKECVWMGRGYINTESVKDRYNIKKRVVTSESKDWKDEEALKISQCSNCGSRTAGNLKDASGIYCCEDCIVESCARKSGVVERSIFDLFRHGEIGTVEIGNEVVDGRAPCSVILQSQRSLYERLNAKTADELFRAEKGDYVLVEDERKRFIRGLVIDVDTSAYKVGLIDRGETVHVTEVYTTTDYLEKEITFGAVITFVGNENPQSKLIKFRASERGPFGIWVCDVLESDENDGVTEIILEEWTPPVKINTVPFDNGCDVVITQYFDAKTMYVRRIDNPWNEDYIRYNNDIAAYCVEAKKYKRIPKKGEICCARFEKDGSYYRAVVRGMKKNLAVISFLDFGNEQLTDVSDLRYLPAIAKQVPAFGRVVTLTGVKLDSTPEAIHYLNRMTAYSCELVLTWEGDGTSEVTLMDKYSGEIINRVIYSYEIPTWVKSRHAFSKSGEIFDYSSLQEVSLPCGKSEDVYVLNFDEVSFRNQGIFWGTANRRDYIGHLHGELKEKMTEFCGGMTEDRYLPRIGELCIALYRGEWSRALCMEDKDVICKLTFIDHGTSFWVETKNIRKILKEFLEMPALALKCAVSDFSQMEESEKETLVAYVKTRAQKAIPGVQILKKSGEIYYLSITVPPEFGGSNAPQEEETSFIEVAPKEIAAIAVSFPTESLKCNEAILTIKNCIDFKTLEIEEPMYRKVSSGMIILQMEGENCKEDAKVLAEELEPIFVDKAVQISCLTAGKLKLTGFADGVTKEDIVEKITQFAGIREDDIQINTSVQADRITVAWVKCPLLSAIDLAKKGTIAIGSSSVKIEIQHRRPVRCFRCLHEGHIGSQCITTAAESKCFRCSQTGHKAADCTERPFCDLCWERGYQPAHRVGSGSCKSRDYLNELEKEYN